MSSLHYLMVSVDYLGLDILSCGLNMISRIFTTLSHDLKMLSQLLFCILITFSFSHYIILQPQYALLCPYYIISWHQCYFMISVYYLMDRIDHLVASVCSCMSTRHYLLASIYSLVVKPHGK